MLHDSEPSPLGHLLLDFSRLAGDYINTVYGAENWTAALPIKIQSSVLRDYALLLAKLVQLKRVIGK